MATDIAFVVGCLAVLGPRVPTGLRMMLLSLAIADDIGAILVIAIGYTEDDPLWWLLGAGAGRHRAGVLLDGLGVRSIPCMSCWELASGSGFHESGVHATIAGVILGLLTPTRPWVSEGLLAGIRGPSVGDLLRGESGARLPISAGACPRRNVAARETISPVERLETSCIPG